MHSLEARTRALFADYGRCADEAVRNPDAVDAPAVADMFAAHFIGSGPQGVLGGVKDAGFPATIAGGFRHYHAIGGTRFEIVSLEVELLDELHAMARVDWEFDYRRPADGATGTIAFRNLYFVTAADGEPKIFAWITPDEAEAMRRHGLA